jgi:phosphatidylglycerol:prolipoprotein diacylglycerol transferase
VFGSIPYHTFPDIHLGPLTLHTFGLMVATGMLLGTVVAAGYASRKGVPKDRVYSLGFRFVLWGIIGARIAWDISHTSDIHSPVDLIAIWNGGLTFTGGFIAAAIASYPVLRKMTSPERWYTADGIALGLTIGLAIGRIGCYSVGEHLGHQTGFFLGVKYLGGVTREGLPPTPTTPYVHLLVGHTYNNTALYEFLHLVLLAGILWYLMYRRGMRPGNAIGIFCLWYGVARFSTDFLRAYDERVLGLTAAQYLCLVLAPVGIWILATSRRRAERLAAIEAGDAPSGTGEDDAPESADHADS